MSRSPVSYVRAHVASVLLVSSLLAFLLWTWLTLLVVGLLAVVTSYFWHGLAFWAGTITVLLQVLRLGLMALAVGWAYLFVDAWRLGQPLTLRLVLDQGYWHDGIYTPSSPDKYAEDILAMKSLGYNTLRKHTSNMHAHRRQVNPLSQKKRKRN